MIHLEDEAALARALDLPIDPHARALLALRRDVLEDAVLTVVEPGDTYAAAEAAVGLPLLNEGEPTFEWALRHPGGVYELAFDFGEMTHVLVVPDRPGVDGELLDLCRAQAREAERTAAP